MSVPVQLTTLHAAPARVWLAARRATLGATWSISGRCADLLGLALLTVALLLVTPVPSAALSSGLLGESFVETKSTTIGAEGEIYRVQAGMQLDLFPEDPAAGWNSVLVLDVLRQGQLTERLVIPGTEGSEVESDAALLFESGQLYILWMSRAEANLSNLDLIGFSPQSSTFGQVIAVSADPLPLKGPPSMAVTRETIASSSSDESEPDGTETPKSITRTVVHLLWWENENQPHPSVFYTPVILVDGEFLGWNPVIEITASALAPELAAIPTSLFSTELLYAANLDRGSDERSVVMAVPDALSGRLYQLVTRLLPDGLVALAEDARSHIVGVGLIQTGTGGGGSGDLGSIAEYARSHIVGIGRIEIHRGVRKYIGAQVAARILEHDEFAKGPLDQAALEALADEAWNEVISSGASLLGNQLRSEDLSCSVLHLGDQGVVSPGAEASESRHQVEFCLSATRVMPATSLDAEHRIVTSEDGSQALVVWQTEDGTLHYRRSDGESWSSVQTVPEAGLDLDDAARLLSAQVRIR